MANITVVCKLLGKTAIIEYCCDYVILLKACIHCTQVPETSFGLLFLEQITQLLCIGVPETNSRNFCSVWRP